MSDETEARPWMLGVYGATRAPELTEAQRGFWLEDVQTCERDAREDLERLSFALLWRDEPQIDAETRAARSEYVGACLASLTFDARRLAACRARQEDPGPAYRATKEGLKRYVKATAATRRNDGGNAT